MTENENVYYISTTVNILYTSMPSFNGTERFRDVERCQMGAGLLRVSWSATVALGNNICNRVGLISFRISVYVNLFIGISR